MLRASQSAGLEAATLFRSQKLRQLRELIHAVERPTLHERFSFSLVQSGIPRGALIEVTGPGKTEAIVQFLAENHTLRVAWIEARLTIYPCAVVQRKVGLERILFVEAEGEVMWAVMQVLRSQLFGTIIVSLNQVLDETKLRRLQLESEKSHIPIFLLTEKLHKAWPISMQIQVLRSHDLVSSELNIQVMKERA